MKAEEYVEGIVALYCDGDVEEKYYVVSLMRCAVAMGDVQELMQGGCRGRRRDVCCVPLELWRLCF